LSLWHSSQFPKSPRSHFLSDAHLSELGICSDHTRSVTVANDAIAFNYSAVLCPRAAVNVPPTALASHIRIVLSYSYDIFHARLHRATTPTLLIRLRLSPLGWERPPRDVQGLLVGGRRLVMTYNADPSTSIPQHLAVLRQSTVQKGLGQPMGPDGDNMWLSTCFMNHYPQYYTPYAHTTGRLPGASGGDKWLDGVVIDNINPPLPSTDTADQDYLAIMAFGEISDVISVHSILTESSIPCPDCKSDSGAVVGLSICFVLSTLIAIGSTVMMFRYRSKAKDVGTDRLVNQYGT